MQHWKPPKMRRFIFEYFVLRGLWYCICLLRNPNRRDLDATIATYRGDLIYYTETFTESENARARPDEVKKYREEVEFPPILWK